MSFILQSSALWYLISPSPLTCDQFSKFFHFGFIPHSAGLYRQASAAEREKRFRRRAFKAFVLFGCQPDLHLAALWLMLTGALTPSRMLCSSRCSYQLLPLCFSFFFKQNPPLQMGDFGLSQFRACWECLHQYGGRIYVCVCVCVCVCVNDCI